MFEITDIQNHFEFSASIFYGPKLWCVIEKRFDKKVRGKHETKDFSCPSWQWGSESEDELVHPHIEQERQDVQKLDIFAIRQLQHDSIRLPIRPVKAAGRRRQKGCHVSGEDRGLTIRPCFTQPNQAFNLDQRSRSFLVHGSHWIWFSFAFFWPWHHQRLRQHLLWMVISTPTWPQSLCSLTYRSRSQPVRPQNSPAFVPFIRSSTWRRIRNDP